MVPGDAWRPTMSVVLEVLAIAQVIWFRTGALVLGVIALARSGDSGPDSGPDPDGAPEWTPTSYALERRIQASLRPRDGGRVDGVRHPASGLCTSGTMAR
jgi:hypothetical protein